MRGRRLFGLALVLGVLAAPLSADAQQPVKRPRIGWLAPGSASTSPASRLEAFRQGLGELGYIEGQNITIEYRWAEGKLERLPGFAAELVRLKVNVIVAGGARTASVAKQATATVPIVVPFTSDLVGAGFVESLARPGGNITGLTAMSPELSGKRLELLKEGVPGISRVAVLWNSVRSKEVKWELMQVAAQTLALKLQSVQVGGPNDVESAFGTIRKERSDALLVFNDSFTSAHRRRIADLASKRRLPAMYEEREFVDAGGVMSYGPHIPTMYRRAASYVDKILKGAKPADLPVEQPTKFELVVNLKTAKALGLTIPRSVLIRADQVIQ